MSRGHEAPPASVQGADAVALYQSRPGATIRSIAADPGVNPETLRNWIRAAGAGRRSARTESAPAPQTPLEAENAALRKQVRDLEEERNVLRKALAISPGRRAGEPLPVRRRPPGRLRREAAVHPPGHRPLQLLLLA
ncbi:transposase [Streptomyces flavidovirens]|uniref:transposase n=1 Tax=Streptomyces flavidovirens TaxID=67298 RepID=UPI0033A13805